MPQPEDSPEPPRLPDLGPKPPVPAEYRFPFKGKMDQPTVIRTRKEREQERATAQKKRGARGFFIGILAGQLIVIGIDLAGAGALRFFGDRFKSTAPVPFPALVFAGMAIGIVLAALVMLAVLGLQGAGWFFGSNRVGFFTAVGRGIKSVVKAAWALGLTLGIVGATAWLMIPGSEWARTATYFQERGLEGRERAKSWVTTLFGKSD